MAMREHKEATTQEIPCVVASFFISWHRQVETPGQISRRSYRPLGQSKSQANRLGSSGSALVALCTGIRIGELCALRWESVSTNDKAIRIAKALQRLHDTSVSQGARTRIVIGPPKSDTSVRTIPMTEYATGLCRRMKPQSSAAYVLTGTEAFMEPRTLQYRLEKYTQACGLEGVHFHTLRHTFATRAVEVGFEVKSLSEILGHTSVTITLDRYVHASLELKRDNMQKLKVVGL